MKRIFIGTLTGLVLFTVPIATNAGVTKATGSKTMTVRSSGTKAAKHLKKHHARRTKHTAKKHRRLA